MPEFYYRAAGSERGPISETQLEALLSSGAIKPDTPIKIGNRDKWYPASSVVERLKRFSVPQPPPLPPSIERPSDQIEFDSAPSDVQVPVFRADHKTTRRSYPALRIIISIYRILGGLVICVGVLMFLTAISNRSELAGVAVTSLFIAIATGIGMIAVAEAISVLLDTEQNTRRSADILESVRNAVEHIAAEADHRN